MMDDIFSTHYECVLNGHTNKAERRDTEHCCVDNGGELYEQQGHCRYSLNTARRHHLTPLGIFRDVLRDPRDEWRDCAMKQRGAEFAECYYREAREIEDELDGVRVTMTTTLEEMRKLTGKQRGDPKRERNSRSNSRDRNNRNHRDNSRNRNHRHRNHRNGRYASVEEQPRIQLTSWCVATTETTRRSRPS